MAKQGIKGSLVESIVQVLTGWGVAIITQLIVYPLMDIEVSIVQNIWISIFEMSVKIKE